MPSPGLEPPGSILFVRLGSIGDVVHVLPAIDAVRDAFPGAKLHFAVETASAPLLADNRSLDRVHVIPRKEWQGRALDPRHWVGIGRQASGVLAELRRAGCDAALDFQGNFRSGFVTWMSGAAARIGFAKGPAKESSHLFYTHKVELPGRVMHRVERNLALIESLGIKASARNPEIPAPAVKAPPLPPSLRRPVAAFHAGVSAFGALKAWPPENFSKAAAAFCSMTGGGAIFTFGPGEEDLASRMAADAGPYAEKAPATGSLAELVALFRSVDAVCGVDTGPVQVAAAAGAPVVALFGPKDPAIYRPLGRVEVLTAAGEGPGCIPCGGRRCSIPDARGFSPCMSAIGPERVAEALVRALWGQVFIVQC